MSLFRDLFSFIKAPVVSNDNFITNSICNCLTCHPFGNLTTNNPNLKTTIKPSQEIKTISSLVDKFTIGGRPSSNLCNHDEYMIQQQIRGGSYKIKNKFNKHQYYHCDHHHHQEHNRIGDRNRSVNIEMKHEKFTPCEPPTDSTFEFSNFISSSEIIKFESPKMKISSQTQTKKIISSKQNTTSTTIRTTNIITKNNNNNNNNSNNNDQYEKSNVIVAPPRKKRRTLQHIKQQQQCNELIHSTDSSVDNISSHEINIDSIETKRNYCNNQLIFNYEQPLKIASNNAKTYENYVHCKRNQNNGNYTDFKTAIKNSNNDDVQKSIIQMKNIKNIKSNNNKNNNNNNNNKSGCSSVEVVRSSLEQNINANYNSNNNNNSNYYYNNYNNDEDEDIIKNYNDTSTTKERISTKCFDNNNKRMIPEPKRTNLIGYSSQNRIYYKDSNVYNDLYLEKNCSHCGRNFSNIQTINNNNSSNNNNNCSYNTNIHDNDNNDDLDEILVCESIIAYANINEEMPLSSSLPLPPPKDSTYTKFCTDSFYHDNDTEDVVSNSSFESQFDSIINRLKTETSANNNNNSGSFYNSNTSLSLISSSPFTKFCIRKQNAKSTRHNSLIKDISLLPSVHHRTRTAVATTTTTTTTKSGKQSKGDVNI